ncbi:MAG TPA: AAA family ATPase [Thermoplasmata archaeon]|nr:AAA family ATPase [Thermoplasmata archaeon]
MPARHGPRGEVVEPQLVGRREELARIHRSLERGAQGQGSLWSITGRAGVGKTRLMAEVARIAVRQGFEVRWGRSTWEGQTPLFPFLQIVHGRVPPRADRPEGRKSLRRFSEEEAEQDLGIPRRRRPGRAPDLIALELLDAIDDASRGAPQLLLIDDFHRSDPDSVRFLRLLARQVSSHRLVVIVSFREESPLFRDAVTVDLTDLLGELRIAGLLQSIELVGLNEEEMSRLGKSVLRTSFPRSHCDPHTFAALVRAAGGNPFYLRELTSMYAETQDVNVRRPTAASTVGVGEPPSEELSLPRSVQELLRRRLSSLPRDHRRVLGIASIIGETFRGEDVAAALADRRQSALEIVRTMAEGEWPIRRLRPSADLFTFQHALLRQASLDLVLPSEKRRLAGDLATLWKRRHPEDLDTTARFFAESNRPSGGLRAVDRLIEEALRSHSFASLDRFLLWKSRIVGTSPKARRKFLGSFFQVLARLRPNAPPELETLCRRFLDLNPPEPERSVVEAWYIDCISNEDAPRADVLLDHLRRRVSSLSGRRRMRARVHLEVSQLRAWMRRGELDSALRTARKVYRSLESEGPSFERLVAAETAASTSFLLGRFTDARRWVERGRALTRGTDLEKTAADLVLLDLESSVDQYFGNVSHAAELSVSLARSYSELSSFSHAARSWLNVATCRLLLGDSVGGRQAISLSLALCRRWGLVGTERGCYAILGQCAVFEGARQEAERYFRRALGRTPGGPLGDYWEIHARIGLAQLALESGRMQESDAQLRIAENLGRRVPLWVAPEAERTRAEWLARSGNIPKARRLLLRSLARSSRGLPTGRASSPWPCSAVSKGLPAVWQRPSAGSKNFER